MYYISKNWIEQGTIIYVPPIWSSQILIFPGYYTPYSDSDRGFNVAFSGSYDLPQLLSRGKYIHIVQLLPAVPAYNKQCATFPRLILPDKPARANCSCHPLKRSIKVPEPQSGVQKLYHKVRRR